MDPPYPEPSGGTFGTLTHPSSLGHIPQGTWVFDRTVTSVFDDMLSRSIPGIDGMRHSVSATALRFARPNSYVVDLGCSLGSAFAPLIPCVNPTTKFIGIEASEPMVEVCRERFRDQIAKGIVEIRKGDLRTDYPDIEASVTLCVLTLMFVPMEHRYIVLTKVFDHTERNGAVVLVEKILGGNDATNRLLTELYHDHKHKMRYTHEEIDRKRLSLEGVLVPVTAQWNEQLLRGAGFQHVECIWRCLNFCAWVAIKA